MEMSIVIKLSDGSTRVIELKDASLQTSWTHIAQGYDPANPTPPQLVGNLVLQGSIKDTDLVGVT